MKNTVIILIKLGKGFAPKKVKKTLYRDFSPNAYLNKPLTAQVGAISKAQNMQNFKVFSSTVPEKPKSLTELARQGEPSDIFYPFCPNSSKKLKG